jgi:glycosyltransferase involved in cell wall biosynthesis
MIREGARTVRLAGRRARRLVTARVHTEVDRARTRSGRADLALFHEFAPPPAGGGHQFLRALVGELERRGLAVEMNRISGGTSTCLYNSFNFDATRLRRFDRKDVRLVHRVDGPIGAYRGFDDGSDGIVERLNRLADATIVQSRFSLAKHAELGIHLHNPVVVHNAPDPAIFFPASSHDDSPSRPLRVVATSWSDNPRKGAETLSWIDRNLDPEEVELTFVGRSEAPLVRARRLPPVATHELAAILRQQDVYLAASRDDPCSNALLEALACGLPAVFLRSGGHPELVGEGGLGFDDVEELPEVFGRMRRELAGRRDAIRVPALRDVADRYLAVLSG